MSFGDEPSNEEKDAYREYEKQLEIAANLNGYSINDPTEGITGYWDQRREAAGDLATLKRKLCSD